MKFNIFKNLFYLFFIFSITTFTFGNNANAQSNPPLYYQGQLLDNNSNAVTGSKSFNVQLLTEGDCVVYKETHASIQLSNGLFSLQLGNGTIITTGISTITVTTSNFNDLISKDYTISGNTNSCIASDGSAIFPPASTNKGILKIKIGVIDVDAGVSTTDWFAAQPLGSVPHSVLAESATSATTADNALKLEGKSASEFRLSVDNIPVAQVTGLHSVATSGAYADLSGKPTIPTAVSQLANDLGYLTSTTLPAQSFASITGKPTTLDGYGITDAPSALGYTPLSPANNLSDLSNASTARSNLGLGGSAIFNVGTIAGTVAAGDDSRFADSRAPNGAAGGDLTDTYPNPTVSNVKVDKISSGNSNSGLYFTYKPNGNQCVDDQVLKWVTATGWVCAADNASGGSTGVTSVTASAPLVSSGGATPNLSMAQATDSADGYLSSGDWTTFNSKQAGNTELTGLGSIALTGIVQRTATGAYTGLGLTAPLSVTGTDIGMTQANTTMPGFLSAADWNTFNGKQNTLGFTPLSVTDYATDVAGVTDTNCAANQKPYWNSTNNKWACTNIFLDFSDISGIISESKLPDSARYFTSVTGRGIKYFSSSEPFVHITNADPTEAENNNAVGFLILGQNKLDSGSVRYNHHIGHENSSFKIWTNSYGFGNQQLQIDPNGMVAIGTGVYPQNSTPQGALDVQVGNGTFIPPRLDTRPAYAPDGTTLPSGAVFYNTANQQLEVYQEGIWTTPGAVTRCEDDSDTNFANDYTLIGQPGSKEAFCISKKYDSNDVGTLANQTTWGSAFYACYLNNAHLCRIDEWVTACQYDLNNAINLDLIGDNSSPVNEWYAGTSNTGMAGFMDSNNSSCTGNGSIASGSSNFFRCCKK